jgi:hypothetical protein
MKLKAQCVRETIQEIQAATDEPPLSKLSGIGL